MKHLNARAQRIFETLTEGLHGIEGHRTIDNNGGDSGIMAVHVERLQTCEAGTIYSIAHYYKQNGDMVCDPDMTFLVARTDGKVYPLTFEMGGIRYEESVKWSDDGQRIASRRPKMQRDQAIFASQWMVNIGDQQSLAPCSIGSEPAR